LATYYQDSNVLADKISSIATITLALIAFIPTINEKIPPTKTFKLIEFIIYLQVFTTFLTLLDSIIHRKDDPTAYETNWETNPFFMITLLFNIAFIAIITGLITFHKLWWENLYTKERPEKVAGKLNRDLWKNMECDEEFRKPLIANKIVVVSAETEMISVSSSSVTEHM